MDVPSRPSRAVRRDAQVALVDPMRHLAQGPGPAAGRRAPREVAILAERHWASWDEK